VRADADKDAVAITERRQEMGDRRQQQH